VRGNGRKERGFSGEQEKKMESSPQEDLRGASENLGKEGSPGFEKKRGGASESCSPTVGEKERGVQGGRAPRKGPKNGSFVGKKKVQGKGHHRGEREKSRVGGSVAGEPRVENKKRSGLPREGNRARIRVKQKKRGESPPPKPRGANQKGERTKGAKFGKREKKP